MRLLSFDQTLSSSGWARFTWDIPEAPIIRAIGTVVTKKKDELKGFYDTLPRARSLYRGMRLVVVEAIAEGIDAIVFEMPAVGGMRAESSLMGATVLQCVAHEVCPDMPMVMAQNQAMKRKITGFQGAEKKDVRDAVHRILGVEKIKANEHVIDALGLGFYSVMTGKADAAIQEARDAT